MSKTAGFSLYELLVTCACLGVVTCMAMPAFTTWLKDAAYREAAQNAFGALREARQLAISTMLEHRVEFDLDNDRFRVTHGDRMNNSTESSWDQNVVHDWDSLNPNVMLNSLSACTKSTGVEKIQLNPNGTSSSRYICIMDENGQPRYRVGVPYSTTGKAVIKRWNSATNDWE